MNLEWDAAKAAANLRKHGVSFDEAASVLFNPMAITVDDLGHANVEVREQTIGLSSKSRVLFVIHTERAAETVRIISARKANRQEVADYEEELKARFPHG